MLRLCTFILEMPLGALIGAGALNRENTVSGVTFVWIRTRDAID